jgi:hypothetical protein
VAAHEKAQDRATMEQKEAQTKHQAELDNLRAVHALEIEAIDARHRKKLQEVTLQNETQVARTRRLAREVRNPVGSAFTAAD